jgi:hypothetical protein
MDRSEIDRKSHSYMLGVTEYQRDKYRDALKRIAAKAEPGTLAQIIARTALNIVESSNVSQQEGDR